MSYCVYVHTSPQGLVYIGITGEKPQKRWKNGKAYRRNTHFYRAIEKYGWENFKHEILYNDLSKERAYEIEKQLIRKYNSTDQRFGYNHHAGGCGSNPGIEASEETRKKRSASMFGKNIGINVGGKSAKAKKISQFDRNGNYLKTWNATTDIQRELGIKYYCVVKCCTNKALTAGGYIWRYADNPSGVEEIAQKINTPKRHSDEQKEKIAQAMLGKRHPTISKPIIATNKNTGEVRYYNSISDTLKDGFCPQNVSKCLSPKYPHSKSLHGFTFEFAEEKRLNERIKALENKAS